MLVTLTTTAILHPKEKEGNYQNPSCTQGLLCKKQGHFAQNFGEFPGGLKSSSSMKPCFSAGAIFMPFRRQKPNVKSRMM